VNRSGISSQTSQGSQVQADRTPTPPMKAIPGIPGASARQTSRRTHAVSSACTTTIGHTVIVKWSGSMNSE
jgi:hypothetical protein